MNFTELIADGFSDVRAHAGRTALQTVGVVLGVASVVGTMGLTAGGRAQSLKYYAESGGVLKVLVHPKSVETVHASAKELASRGLTLDDVTAIRASIPGYDLVEPDIDRYLPVRTARLSKSCEISGCGPRYQELHELLVDRGRFLTDEDVGTAAAVCVLGYDRAAEFFGSEDPLGQNVRIGDHSYRVVGVMPLREFYWNKGDSYNALGWMNELVVVPVTAILAREVGAGSQKIDEISLRLASVEAHKEAAPALRRLLLARHGAEDFQIYDRQERLQQMQQNGKVYDITFLVCGIISLIVGAIVVANIMLASFTERMREVGVRKALGAKGRHIAVQFLVEGFVVTGLGGAAGLFLGFGFVNGMAYLLDQPAILTPAMVVAAAASAIGVGLVAGSIPAVKAARLDPVVALRYE
ncbi:MAG TPA: ABC transporter permease [Thermoanaerobaculaceae bacterium]|nr:ABC transporter permease [Thermoanaerobaculaceae bacterium]